MNKEQKERFEAELLKIKETKEKIKNLAVDSASRFMESLYNHKKKEQIFEKVKEALDMINKEDTHVRE